MSTLITEVDARTRLAGANQMELLLFHVGTSEVFGINVFKVREVMKVPTLTRVPETDARIEGLANIRGLTVPVLDLKRILGLGGPESAARAGEDAGGNLIVTEFNASLQAFHVEGVDRILRISWSHVKPPPRLIRDTAEGAVTAVTMLEDGRMVLILDVEKVLADVCAQPDEEIYAGIRTEPAASGKRVLIADDSAVARKQIMNTLERLGVAYVQATTGQEAWDYLMAVAAKAGAEGKPVQDEIGLILSDIEMPEMDGFTLTKQIRSDPRLAGIPVILHSSLTGTCNVMKAKAVGATDYVTKFDPKGLSETLLRTFEKQAIHSG